MLKYVSKQISEQSPVRRAVLNVSTHSQSATPTQQLKSVPLTKCSLTLQVDFRDRSFWKYICFDVLYLFINLNEEFRNTLHIQITILRWVPQFYFGFKGFRGIEEFEKGCARMIA